MDTDPATTIDALDWPAIEHGLRGIGYAACGPVLAPATCRTLAALYDDDRRFRSTVDMARYRFGEGQYRYFARPLPDPVARLRQALYRRLAPIANRMAADMGLEVRYPRSLKADLRQCHAAGQDRLTPLLLRYGAGGYNCLHQDLYGALRFPLQAVIQLSRPGDDFAGGEFLLVEQRPRAQSVGHALNPGQGEMIVFPVAERPVRGTRGFYRAKMRHGVSQVRAGTRMTLGLILHDAA